jgi:putative transposase
MKTHSYLTDLSDAEWAWLEPLFPAARTGRVRHYSLRTIVHALLDVLRAGCAWRLLPPDWPPWQSVYYYLRQWRREGTRERIHTVLREQLRIALGRNPQPNAGSVDSQSVKTTSVGGGERGDEAMMAPRNWSGASGLCWSIPKDCSWRSMSIRPPSWIAMASR